MYVSKALLGVIWRYAISGIIISIISSALICIYPAYSEEQVYYSIHIASFKELLNANRYVNELGKKGKLVFWKEADIPEKGIFYRVYLGKYRDREKAVEFWNKLNDEGKVSYFGVHSFTENFPLVETDLPPEIVDEDEAEIEKPVISMSVGPRFVDNQDGTITDNQTKLMWIKNGWRIDFFSAVKWKDALKKLEDFNLAGFSDWRLPTIKEWQTLLDKKKEYPAMVEPNPFENLIVHMPYWSNTEYQFLRSNKGISQPSRIYTVMLYYGRIGHQNVNQRAFILPVREIK